MKPAPIAICCAVALAACADDDKRPNGAVCETNAQCQSGTCLDAVCVDPNALSGQASFHLVNPSWTIESSDQRGRFDVLSSEPILLTVGADEDQLAAEGGCASDFTLTPADPQPLKTLVSCDEAAAEIPFTQTAVGFTIDEPAEGPYVNPLGFTESAEAQTLTFIGVGSPSPREAEAFVGYWARRAVVGENNQIREANLALLARASTKASVDDLVGGYGVIRLLTLVDVDLGQLEVDVAHYAGAVSQTEGGAFFDVTDGASLYWSRDLGGEGAVTPGAIDDDSGGSVPITVAADGAFTLAGDPSLLRGAITPDGSLWVASAGAPDPVETEATSEPIIDESARFAQYEALVGVRRDPSPALGGRVYRVVRHEIGFEPGQLAVTQIAGGSTLTFDATGATATADFTSESWTTGFGGSLDEPGPERGSIDLTVAAPDATGLIRMTNEGDGATIEVFGFVEAGGGDVLIFGDRTVNGAGDAGSIGFGIGLCQNCP